MKVSEDQPASVARIRNTLHLEDIWVNEAAFVSMDMQERLSDYIPLSFDKSGNLLPER
jgi:hypothetical protein